MRTNWWSLLALVALVSGASWGCNGGGGVAESLDGPVQVSGDPPPLPDDACPAEGPHGGQLVSLGKDRYHVELTCDKETGEVVAYLLDADATAPIVGSEVTLNLIANQRPLQYSLRSRPESGETDERASRFVLVDADAVQALEDPGLTGRVYVKVDDRPFGGRLAPARAGHARDGHVHAASARETRTR